MPTATSEQAPFDAVPDDRFCDIVLTGGITSGVVYPPATIELAKAYRFRNIGGASAGAMAAALTAAAEYRRCQGSSEGFDVLARIPHQLAQKTGADKTTLLSLFQPAAGTRRLFRLFLGLLAMREGNGVVGQAFVIVRSLLRAYLLPALGGLAAVVVAMVALAPWLGPPGPLGAVLALALAASIGVAIALYRDLTLRLDENNFGVCNGGKVDPAPDADPALVEWLHQGIQAIAGLGPDKPLTFRDLQQEGWQPPAWLKLPAHGEGSHRINLQMVTTNLSHGRPYRLPLVDTTSRLYFKESDLQPYFPDAVMRELMRDPEPYVPRSEDDPRCSPETAELYALPNAGLPIVVAARLSLSFPFLFSAVPLWAIDYERPPNDRHLRRCWFSDGGISSNFPIHFFDKFLPRWPTFGISLGRRSRFWEHEPVWLPTRHSQGRGDSWNRFDDSATAGGRLAGFAAAIVSAAKDWTDHTAMRMPGVRDRVVRIGFSTGEGELNLDMASEVIERIAQEYGSEAGRLLVRKFAPTSGQAAASGWNEHRWVRFNTLLHGLRECIGSVPSSAAQTAWSEPIPALVAKAHVERPLAGDRDVEDTLSAGQADAMDRLLRALIALEAEFEAAGTPQPYRPLPAPELRNRAPL